MCGYSQVNDPGITPDKEEGMFVAASTLLLYPFLPYQNKTVDFCSILPAYFHQLLLIAFLARPS
jgi:hypothetical protein